MPLVSRNVLKRYFWRGALPTEGQFYNLVDSLMNLVDDRYLLGLRTYDPAGNYIIGDATIYNNSLYVCIANTTGVFDPASWQLISSFGAVVYTGTWNAATNTPDLSDGTGTKGFYYVVATAGSVNFGSGTINFQVSDWVIYNGAIWQKVDNSQTSGIASDIIFTPEGDITATNVQDAIVQVYDLTDIKLAAKQNILSLNPTFYPFASGVSTLSDGSLVELSNGVGLVAGKVFRSMLAEKAQIDFAAGNSIIISTDGGVTNESALLMDAASVILGRRGYGQLSITAGNLTGELTLLNGSANGIRINSNDVLLQNVLGPGALINLSADGKINLQSDVLDINAQRTVFSYLNPSTVPYIDGDKNLVSSTVTLSQLDYLSGVSSSIQAQLDNKLDRTGGSMLGQLFLFNDPVEANEAATKNYVDIADAFLQSQLSSKLDLTGGSMQGALLLFQDPIDEREAATKQYVDVADALLQSQLSRKLDLTGGSMQGQLLLFQDPVEAREAATKQYVDAADNFVLSQLGNKLDLAGGNMQGPLLLFQDPLDEREAATKQYVDVADALLLSQLSRKLDITGGNMSGFLTLHADPTLPLGAVTKQYVDNSDASLRIQIGSKLNISGGTMTGDLVLNANPTLALGAATKQYVDSAVSTTGAKAIALPFTFFVNNGNFSVTSLNTWTRLTSSNPILQMRVVIPPPGTIYPGTTTASVRIVLDYMTSAGAEGRIGLYDYTRFGPVAPISGSDSILTTSTAWGVRTGPSFPLIGPVGYPMTNSCTVELLLQKTAGGVGTSVSIESATLIVTYA